MVNYFDQLAKNWDNDQQRINRAEAIAARLLTMIEIRKEMKALEFGAGSGLLSFALKDHFSEITLMDSSSGMINVVKSKIEESDIRHMSPVVFDLERNNFNGGKFDIIYTQMAMHHVENVGAIINRFYELLNPSGIVAIADLYKEDGTFHDFGFKGHLGFSPDNFAGILQKGGFSLVKYEQCFVIEKKSEDGAISKYPVFILTGSK